ncbi:MAG: hypothetical protein Q9220_006186 [cf. Caloplaca sp. 1 TL-2023]
MSSLRFRPWIQRQRDIARDAPSTIFAKTIIAALGYARLLCRGTWVKLPPDDRDTALIERSPALILSSVNMSLVSLKNLVWYGRAIPQHAKSTPSAPNSTYQKDREGKVTIKHLEKSPESSWISSSSSVDVEAGANITAIPECTASTPHHDSFSSKAKYWSHHGYAALKAFRPTPRMISDAIIGLSDGMTVPFALTASLSAIGNTRIVVLGGVAELIAGMVSMGVGGALGAKAESDGYKAKMADTAKLVLGNFAEANELVHNTLRPYGFNHFQREIVSKNLMHSPERTVDYLMRFHHQEPRPDPSRPVTCGLTIGIGYALGGLIPLVPYFCVERHQVLLALYISIGVMVFALFIFGYVKTVLLAEQDRDKSTWKAVCGGLGMVAIGGGSAAVAVGVVHGISTSGGGV